MQIEDYNGKELNIGDKCLVSKVDKYGIGRQYKFVERYITRITDSMIWLDTEVNKVQGYTKVAIDWSSKCIIKL